MRSFLKSSALKVMRICQMRVTLIVMLCLACAAAVIVLGGNIKTVSIFDGQNTSIVRSLSGNVQSALTIAGFSDDEYRVLDSSVSGNKACVTVAKTFPVYITVGKETRELYTVSSTVADILAEAGYSLDQYDMIQPKADTLVTETAYIDYADVSYVTGSYTESIPASVDKVYSNKYAAGSVITVSSGTNGVKKIEYTEKMVNGVSVEKVTDNVITLKNAVNGKQIIGTGAAVSVKPAVITSDSVKSISTLNPSSPIALDADGNPVNYKKHITVQATAYTYTGKNCSTGVAPQPGYIAVNPKVIPYGTKMYIKSSDGRYIYGYAVAADTGGFIKSRPNNVDLFMTTKSACSTFGRRNVEIYILE